VRRLRLPTDVAREVELQVQAGARLNHPTILRPLEVGESKGIVQIVSEAPPAVSLRDVFEAFKGREEKLPISHITWMMLEVLTALRHAHEMTDTAGKVAPVIHGRLSPEHISITREGEVRVAGWGLDAAARYLLAKREQTVSSLAYLAPESLDAPPVKASDIFAVACVAAEGLTGKPLFVRPNWADTAGAIRDGKLPDFRAARPEVPLALDSLLTFCLEPHIDKRCQHVEAVQTRLTAFQGMLEAADRIKPGQHGSKLSDLVRLRLGTQTEPEIAVEAPTIFAPPALPDEDVKTRIFAPPQNRPKRRRGKWVAAALTFALTPFIALGWVAWPELRATYWHQPKKVAVVVLPETRLTPKAPPPVDLPPPPKPAAATLSIRTDPPSFVSLDGSEVGQTPLSALSVPPGDHTFAFYRPKAHLRMTRKVTLQPGETKALELKLRR
jgi:hypothetical protein